MAKSQTWTQLGPGVGGQERAVFLYENPTTNLYDLMVGSDVSGVWRANNIDPLQMGNPAQYNFRYLSNNDLDWERLPNSEGICGDPIDMFISSSLQTYIVVNQFGGGRRLYQFNQGNYKWDLIMLWGG